MKPYVIVGDLGKGSFATVYRGYHEVRPSMHPITQPPNQSMSPYSKRTSRSQSRLSTGAGSVRSSSITYRARSTSSRACPTDILPDC